MKRFSSIFFGLTLAASFAGCGTTTNNNNGGGADMAKAGIVDMAGGGGSPDLLVVAAGAPTGDPCTKATDCAKGLGPNQSAQCTKSVMQQGGGMLVWPGGYCTTPCRTAKTDQNNNGLNTDCPGGNATCAGSTGNGTCVAACQSSMDCRTDYACFVVNNIAPYGCEPKAISECDPAKAGSCPRMCPDGGVDLDAGACYENTCVNVGDGTVGACVSGCDAFANVGCPGSANETDCHQSDVTGEGLCTGAAAQGVGAGAMCGNFYSDCPGGYGCNAGLHKCYKYCKDSNKGTQCSNGAACDKLNTNTKVPTSIGGICHASL